METANPELYKQIIILAVLVEATVQTLKPIWEKGKRTPDYYVSLIVGFLASIGTTYLANVDIFEAMGVPLVKAPIVGVILTGIILTRGANIFHDILKLIEQAKIAMLAKS